jgi:hypothetical protein
MTETPDIERSKDRKGRYYRGGGRKFYYEPGNADSRRDAKRLARNAARKAQG